MILNPQSYRQRRRAAPGGGRSTPSAALEKLRYPCTARGRERNPRFPAGRVARKTKSPLTLPLPLPLPVCVPDGQGHRSVPTPIALADVGGVWRSQSGGDRRGAWRTSCCQQTQGVSTDLKATAPTRHLAAWASGFHRAVNRASELGAWGKRQAGQRQPCRHDDVGEEEEKQWGVSCRPSRCLASHHLTDSRLSLASSHSRSFSLGPPRGAEQGSIPHVPTKVPGCTSSWRCCSP